MPENQRIRRHNVERFRRLLAGQVAEEDRAVLLRLLAEAEDDPRKPAVAPRLDDLSGR